MDEPPSPTPPIVRRVLPWIGVTIAVGVAAFPILRGGFPRGHDWSHELVRLAQYRAALADGQLPPAWAPDLYGGLGSPIFLFYAPLFALLATAAHGFVGPFVESVAGAASVVLVLAPVAGGLGVGLLARNLVRDDGGGRRWGPTERLAVVLFVLHPYLLGDALVRNANAEYLALCLLPLPLAAVAEAGRYPRRAVLGLGAGLCLVVLAHNLTALVAVALVVGGTVALHLRGPVRAWLAVAGGGILGLGLSAWFWLPALALGEWVRRDELLGGHLDFHEGFVSVRELFDGSVFFSAGPLTAVLAAVALWAVATGRVGGRRRTAVVAALVGAALAVALMLPIAEPLWEALPWLALFQFPWRFVGPLALLVSVAGAISLAGVAGGDRAETSRRIGWLEASVLVLAVANALPVLLLARPLPTEIEADLGETLRPEEVRRFGHRATVGDEYVPAGADLSLWRPDEAVSPVLAGPTGTEVEVLRRRGTDLALRVISPASGELVVGRWFFPGWSARVDGRDVSVGPSPDGALAVPVEAGEQRVEVSWLGLASRRVGLGVSAATGVVFLGLAVAWRRDGSG